VRAAPPASGFPGFRLLTNVRDRRTIVRIMRTPRGQVQDWLFPRVRRAVLTLLMMDSDKRWHLRDIARKADCAVGSVRRELQGLADCGIVVESRDGNRTYYQANPQCPVYAELAGMVRKTSGLADVLRAALAGLGARVQVAFVYGSQARQEAGPGSDVDLMVIGEAGFAEVVSALAQTQDTLGREINPTVYSVEEFDHKVSSGHHFVRSVLKDRKIFLIGDADELGKLAK
jgi:predicted nucleotidyltransferase